MVILFLLSLSDVSLLPINSSSPANRMWNGRLSKLHSCTCLGSRHACAYLTITWMSVSSDILLEVNFFFLSVTLFRVCSRFIWWDPITRCASKWCHWNLPKETVYKWGHESATPSFWEMYYIHHSLISTYQPLAHCLFQEIPVMSFGLACRDWIPPNAPCFWYFQSLPVLVVPLG